MLKVIASIIVITALTANLGNNLFHATLCSEIRTYKMKVIGYVYWYRYTVNCILHV
jgi:hypothetical protein